MRYIILHILCEGPTEDRFVKKILSPFFQHNIELGTTYQLCSFDEVGLCDRLYEYYKFKKK